MSDPNPANIASAPSRRIKALLIAALTLSAGAFGVSVVALLFATGVLTGGAASPGLEAQVRAIVSSHPEMVVDAINQMEARQKAAEENELTTTLAQRHEEVFDDPSSPVGANPNGDVRLVEFFDYNCPYCRKAAAMLNELERTDLGVRLVYKEFPILGPGSTFAARAALASRKQDKYLAFHDAMIAYKGAITESSALEVAAAVGLDIERLKKDITDPAIDGAIKRNLALAEALRIARTPSFVSGKEITRGLVDLNTMKRLITAARQK